MAKKDDEKVGYKRPPKSTQFKPGQSGNSKGKPKGSYDLQRALARALAEPVSVNTPNGKRHVTVPQMLVRKGISEVSQGNLRAWEILLQTIAKLPAAEGPSDNDNTQGDPGDEEVLAGYRRKILGAGGGSHDE